MHPARHLQSCLEAQMVGDWNNQYFEADPILPVPLVHVFFFLITKDDDNKSLSIYNKLCTPYTFSGAIQKRNHLTSLFVWNPSANCRINQSRNLYNYK
jgi:hypothetical protein